jgi:8-amino-3,8-dideoxy-alpha-D-manno-octulosonate transaminase
LLKIWIMERENIHVPEQFLVKNKIAGAYCHLPEIKSRFLYLCRVTLIYKFFYMPGYEFFGEEERRHVNDVMQIGILMRYGFDGPRKGIWKAQELEASICETFSCKHAQLVSSGTAALTTALTALSVGYGDEVILPAFTFVASFEAVLSVGAIPVLVDVDDTLTLSPAAVRNAITTQTKCIMPVHMCGSMADMDQLLSICKEHKLLLLEDACQSIGGSYHGRKLGTIGDAGTFSFDFVKTITCAEGGVVMTNREDVYLASDGFSDHGHDHKGADRGADLHPFIGYNYRISELHAAVGLAQIGKLPQFLSIQHKNHAALKNMLSAVPEITFRRIPDEAGDSCTFLSWFLPTPELTQAVVTGMRAAGIMPGSFYWFENNWHYISKWDHLRNGITLNKLHPELRAAVIKHASKDFSASDAVMSRCVSTLISLSWTESQLEEKGQKMVALIRKVLQEHAVTY